MASIGNGLAYRLHVIGHLSDWQYKSICIELGKRGYRKSEPDGIEREVSTVWQTVLRHLWSERTTKDQIAGELKIPLDEFQSVIWSLTSPGEQPQSGQSLQVVPR